MIYTFAFYKVRIGLTINYQNLQLIGTVYLHFQQVIVVLCGLRTWVRLLGCCYSIEDY